MISQRQQPSYDPMAQMMQILQFALNQNQQVQQQANQDRNYALDKRQLNLRADQFDQSLQQQNQEQQFREKALKQQEQQAIMAALSRAMPQDANGFDDPSALYQYLQQIGVQVPTPQVQPGVDPQAEAEKARARAILSQLLQQQQQ